MAVILDQRAMGPEWQSWLTHELALRGVLLGTDGTILEGDILFGFFRFLEPAEAEAALQLAHIPVAARDLLRLFLPRPGC